MTQGIHKGTLGLIEHWQLLKFSKEELYYCLVKEFLIAEIEDIRKVIDKETQNAIIGKVPNYLITIFVSKLEERKDFLNHLLNDILYKIKIEKESKNNQPNTQLKPIK